MKNRKMIAPKLALMLLMLVCFATSQIFAQTNVKSDASMMKDCCMMKDGKMMQMKDGKMTPMSKDMTMKNGAKCMKNGECIMKDGTKMKMKEGDCMDMNGKMDKCSMMNQGDKSSVDKKHTKQDMATMYMCPMHNEITSDKLGKCSKCGMDLVEKK